ncbi:MAG: hypothetical protein RMJ28_05900 [Nitrososphaerota archaeon]|nr:hypothetical protein [Candidatus Calditenuaceae archaeon]MDW8073747.1 hypothetical protein [Nitrososphaerota archaeon]
MILETHGEVCRLGYLRLIIGAAKTETPGEHISPSFVAAILEESLKRLGQEPHAHPDITGLIRSSVAARNYVSFALNLDLISRQTLKLGENGTIYAFTRSLSPIEAFLKGETKLSLIDLLTLRPVDKVFFLWLLLTQDYLILPGIIKWTLEREVFTRTEAMNHVMEELYPQALTSLLAAVGKKAQKEILSKIEMAKRFREERMKYATKAHWIRSSLYAKYRHVVPPRLEWLVDLGILNRVRRGRYAVSDQILSHKETLNKALTYPPSKLRENIFTTIAPLFIPYTGRPSREALNRELVQTFNIMSTWLEGPVKVSLLEMTVCVRLLENNQIATPTMVRDTINKLSILYPDKIYLTPGPDENLYLTKINLGPKEITQ